jgi:hypothetical protein
VADSYRGTVRWAVVPYVPSDPFRLYAGTEQAPRSVTAASLLNSKLADGGEVTFLTPGKVRPVLVLDEPPGRGFPDDVTALRLLRLSKLTPHEQDEVREQRHPMLFYLSPDRIALHEENAAMVSALVNVHVSALSEQPLGSLNTNELRVIGERVIGFYGFDTHMLVERRITELAHMQRQRSKPDSPPTRTPQVVLRGSSGPNSGGPDTT